MASAKLICLCAVVAVASATSSKGFLDSVFVPKVLQSYRLHLEAPNGSKSEEMGMVVNPGTAKEKMVFMRSYSEYDEETDTETIDIYTADIYGNRTHYMLEKHKLSSGSMKSLAG